MRRQSSKLKYDKTDHSRGFSFIFNVEGTALFAFATTGDVLRIDPEQGTVVASVAVASPRGLAWTWDHRHLIAGGNDELVFLNLPDLTVASQIGNLGTGQIFYPSATPDGRWILAPAVLDGVVLVIDATTGGVAHRVETGSPPQVVPDGRRAWVSNVLVPPKLLEPNAAPRLGGVVLLDLTPFRTVAIPDIIDAHGIGVSPVRLRKDQQRAARWGSGGVEWATGWAHRRWHRPLICLYSDDE